MFASRPCLASLFSSIAFLLAAPALAGAKPMPDSDAPPGSPPHWLPSGQWVFNHWLPYDEARLYKLLRIDRADLWRHLRDDSTPIAELAASKGWKVDRLARALVAPRRGSAVRQRLLRSRARRTLTQGHLSQHLFFHTLHQEILPGSAKAIFGVSRERMRTLRRLDLGPLEIARLAGRGHGSVLAAARRGLRDAARRGIRGGFVSQRQSQLLLSRQLRQLPRWLNHRRYNGPPPTRDGKLVEPLRPHALRPSLSGDGRDIVFEQSQPDVPRAVAEGEISVRLVGGSIARTATPGPGAPCSIYNGSLARMGRYIVAETSAGNRNFAKRYGDLRVVRVDRTTGEQRIVAAPGRGFRTAYAPSISDDGRVVAFVAAGGAVAHASRVHVADLDTGKVVAVPGAGYKPQISGDGRTLAYTRVDSGRSVVVLRDVASGRQHVLAPSGGRGEAYEPSMSQGSRVAFVERAPSGARIVVADRAGRRLRHLRAPKGTLPGDPALSADGRHVAFSVTRRGRSAASGRPRQDIVLADVLGRSAAVASRTSAGAVAGGYAAHATLSADGQMLAFTSDAPALAGARDGVQRVFVRDLRAGTTSQVSGEPGLEASVPGTCAQRPPVW